MVVSASLLILVITWLAQGAAAALPSKMEYHSPGYALILAREKIRIQNPKYGLY